MGHVQADQERGGQVRKGEKSTQVVFWKLLDKTETIDGETTTKKIPLLRSYRVFNIDQCDWAEDAKLPQVAERTAVDAIEGAEALIASYLATGPSLGHGGNRAFYRLAADHIQMPERRRLQHRRRLLQHPVPRGDPLHRPRKRLARPGIAAGTFGSFGDPVYCFEELVAEMGAAMLSAVAGIEQTAITASAAYLAHWRDALKGDNKLIVQAAAQAQKAMDLVLGTTFEKDDEES